MAGNILYMGNEKYRLRVSNGFDSNGKRKYFNKTVTCSSKREAEKELAKFITSIEGGCTYSAKKVTLNDFSKQWLETYVKPNLSPITYQSYNEKLNKNIESKELILKSIKTPYENNIVGMKLNNLL